MPVRVFVSSEMRTDTDRRRRQTAISEISRLGHTPVYFEGQPSRALEPGEDPLSRCGTLVRRSDILVAIIDDAVSPAMAAELEEAEKRFGRQRISYYFTRGGARDPTAAALWNRAKATHVLVEFGSDSELTNEIGKSIGSYVEDAVSQASAGPKVAFDEVRSLLPGHYSWEAFPLSKGTRLVVTCESQAKFYARLMKREAYVRFRRSGGATGMPFGSDGVAFTDEIVADRDDECYVAVKAGLFNNGLTLVRIRAVEYRKHR